MWAVEWANPHNQTKWEVRKFQGKNAADNAYVFWRNRVENYHRDIKVFLVETVNGKRRNVHSDGGK